MPNVSDPVLSLQEAADALGVHYMTAYRYVRLGYLAAYKEGGGWRVTRDALDDYLATRDEAPTSGRRAPWCSRLEGRLLAGDATGAWGVVEAALSAGADVHDVYLDVLTPAMRSIGDRWEHGEIDVAVEHRASVIAGRLVGRLGARCVRRGRPRGAILVGSPAGERHGLASAVLADLLRLDGWEVSDLGADVPVVSFVRAASSVEDLVAVAVSVTTDGALDACAATCAALRGIRPRVPIVVGGRAVRGAEHAAGLGADAFAESPDEVAAAIARRGAPAPVVEGSV